MVLLWSFWRYRNTHPFLSLPALRVGVILGFFSNEKSFDSLENFQDSLLTAANNSIDFTETGLLVCVCVRQEGWD